MNDDIETPTPSAEEQIEDDGRGHAGPRSRRGRRGDAAMAAEHAAHDGDLASAKSHAAHLETLCARLIDELSAYRAAPRAA